MGREVCMSDAMKESRARRGVVQWGQCIMGNGHMGISPPPWTKWLTKKSKLKIKKSSFYIKNGSRVHFTAEEAFCDPPENGTKAFYWNEIIGIDRILLSLGLYLILCSFITKFKPEVTHSLLNLFLKLHIVIEWVNVLFNILLYDY